MFVGACEGHHISLIEEIMDRYPVTCNFGALGMKAAGYNMAVVNCIMPKYMPTNAFVYIDQDVAVNLGDHEYLKCISDYLLATTRPSHNI
jgi:hypothetical protein